MWVHAPQHTEVLGRADLRAETDMKDSRCNRNILFTPQLHEVVLTQQCTTSDCSTDESFPTCLQFEACGVDGEKCQLLLLSLMCITFITSANSHWRFLGQVRLEGFIRT